ncbi:MAG TPA: HIT domain-containing protein [Ktedonobacterales bacterium]
MRQLWAPWRMAYVEGDTGAKPDCIFCAKAAEDKDDANLILLRSHSCFALMNIYPYNTGHLMIAPYAHVPSIQQLDSTALTDMMVSAQRLLGALQAALGPQGFNLGINQGVVAGAGIVDHAHLHIVPRWNGDTNFMPVVADVKVVPEALSATYRKILERLVGTDAQQP